jgi:hypothetical protein
MSLSDLDLTATTGVDPAEYEKPQPFSRPPLPGAHSFSREGDPDFGKTRGGDLMAKMTFKVLGGEDDGKTFIDRIFTTPSTYRKSTSADDYIRACGGAPTDSTVGAYVDAINSYPGPFAATLKWEGYCKSCETTTIGKRGMPRFQSDEDGVLNHIATCPTCDGKVGAQAKVARYIVEDND